MMTILDVMPITYFKSLKKRELADKERDIIHESMPTGKKINLEVAGNRRQVLFK